VDFDSITNFLIVSALKCINEAKEAKDLNTSIGTLRNRTSLHAQPYAYKLSITFQSYRLFTTAIGREIIKSLMVWITLCGIVSVCGSLFYCTPISK